MNAILTSLYSALLKQSALLLAKYSGHALQPEDLLHMAIERILHRPPPERMHHAHILRGLVMTVMQRVLVDEWRRNSTARRRDAASAVPLEEAAHIAAAETETWPEVDEALAGLRSELPESAVVVELRFFHGVRQCEIARTLAVSTATMSRRWRSAVIWLRHALTPPSTAPLRAA
jgi:RNA polymerase sigma factor (TIGR02999 family)